MLAHIKNQINGFLKRENPYIRKAARSLIASLPGGILYYKTGDSAWFSVTLVSIACCIPYGENNYNILRMLILCISYDVLFSIQTYALNFPLVYAFVIFIMGFFYVYATRDEPNLRQYYSWIFIPSLYTAIEFHEKFVAHASRFFFERIYYTPISFLSAFIVCYLLLPEKKKVQLLKPSKHRYFSQKIRVFFHTLKGDLISQSHPILRQAQRTASAVLFSFCVVYFFNIKEGEWLIWSSASIILTYTRESIQKTKQRFLGLIFGLGVGFLFVKTIPQSPILTLIFSFLIFITLSGAIKNYAIAFGSRCALVLATGAALDGSVNAGIERFENVTIGILIGTIATFFLWPNKVISNKKT